MMHSTLTKIKRSFFYGLTIIFILMAYEAMSIYTNNVLIMPGIKRIYDYGMDFDFLSVLKTIWSTVFRVLKGYVLSIVIALLLAILANIWSLKQVIQPLVSMFRSIPTISVIIIILIWFTNEMGIYMIGFLVVFPILYEVFYKCIHYVNPKLLEVAQVYQFSLLKRIEYIYFYSVLEQFFMSLKQTFGLALKVMIMAEVIGQAKTGIGAEINRARINIEMEGIFIWSVLLIMLVLIMDVVFEVVSKRVLKWK